MGVVVAKQDRGESLKHTKFDNILHGKRVLVVDDSSLQRNRLKELYESLGMVIAGEAENGLDALDLADSTHPDIISLDILMPVMHGIETMCYLREAKNPAVIVLVSALPDLDNVNGTKFNGYSADAVFSKKESREAFHQRLSELFLSHMSEKESEKEHIA